MEFGKVSFVWYGYFLWYLHLYVLHDSFEPPHKLRNTNLIIFAQKWTNESIFVLGKNWLHQIDKRIWISSWIDDYKDLDYRII